MVTKRRGSALPRVADPATILPEGAITQNQGPADKECEDADPLMIPRIAVRTRCEGSLIVRTAPGIEKGRGPDKETPALLSLAVVSTGP